MTALAITTRGATDVGRVRDANEDDFLVGESIVAVADGMGGHLAGEVASATALESLRPLDGRVFDDGDEALATLRDAVIDANRTVSTMASEDSRYRGMGTTLTAAMILDGCLHLAHVGDSRAYLLRHGEFSQITDDHTLVQHLVDEGQITREEATTHPQRSIITRAIGVSPEVEVDALSVELEDGDQVLLCSDGLTGVVDDDRIADELRSGDDADATLARLVSAANDGGGPDNITVVLLRYGPPTAATANSQPAPVRIGTRDESDGADWAGRLGSYGSLTRDGGGVGTGTADDHGPGAGRIVARVVAALAGTALLVGLALFGGRFLLDRSFYVGIEGDDVVIYQGVDVEIGPFELSRVVERTDVRVEEIAAYYRPSLEEGRTATDLQDARRLVDGAPRSDADEDTDTDADADVPDAPDGDDPPATDEDGSP